jgi:uncharacterized membrane protein YbaN (DUF454 family)
MTVQAIGVALVLFGVAGLFLPVLQGALSMMIGLLLLSVYSPNLRAWLVRHASRHPKVYEVFLKAESFVTRVVGN